MERISSSIDQFCYFDVFKFYFTIELPFFNLPFCRQLTSIAELVVASLASRMSTHHLLHMTTYSRAFSLLKHWSKLFSLLYVPVKASMCFYKNTLTKQIISCHFQGGLVFFFFSPQLSGPRLAYFPEENTNRFSNTTSLCWGSVHFWDFNLISGITIGKVSPF